MDGLAIVEVEFTHKVDTLSRKILCHTLRGIYPRKRPNRDGKAEADVSLRKQIKANESIRKESRMKVKMEYLIGKLVFWSAVLCLSPRSITDVPLSV